MAPPRLMLPAVHCEPSVRDYIVRLTQATRAHDAVELGASPAHPWRCSARRGRWQRYADATT